MPSDWTDFTLPAGAIEVYVSSSTGSDGNIGTEGQPIQTLAEAVSRIVPGRGDHILLKRNDRWDEGISNLNNLGGGAGVNAKLIISSYGTGSRPRITQPFSDTSSSGSLDHFALVGLDFWAVERDPSQPEFDSESTVHGLRLFGSFDDLLIEDCVFRFWRNGITLQEFGGTSLSNFTLRRSMVIDTYQPPTGHAQGMFLFRIDGVLVEECLFDKNGFNVELGREPTVFNHCTYFNQCKNWTVRWNIFGERGNIGVKDASDLEFASENFEISENLFIGAGGVCIEVGHSAGLDPGASFGNRNGQILRNVAQRHGRDFSSTGFGVQAFGNWIQDGQNLDIHDNIYCHQTVGGSALVLNLREGAEYPIDDVEFHNNIIYNWTANDLISVGSQVTNYSQVGNDIEEDESKYVDPNRIVSQTQVDNARNQSRTSWNPDLTGETLSAWVIEGFADAPTGPTSLTTSASSSASSSLTTSASSSLTDSSLTTSASSSLTSSSITTSASSSVSSSVSTTAPPGGGGGGTLIDIGPIQIPRASNLAGTNFHMNPSNLLDEAGDYRAAIIQAPITGNIKTVGFRTRDVTTGGDLEVTIETLDASGHRSGTLVTPNTEGTITIADTDDNTWKQVTLNNVAQVTMGDFIAVVFTHTGDGAIIELSDVTNQNWTFPYTSFSTNGGGIKQKSSKLFIIGLQYDDDIWYPIPGKVPLSEIGSEEFQSLNTDNEDEIALRFQLPYDYSVNGYWLSFAQNTAHKISLYDLSDNILTSINIPVNLLGSTLPGNSVIGYFPDTIELSANTFYRIGVEFNDSAPFIPDIWEYDNNAVMNAADGGTIAKFLFSSRQRGGSWTDADNKVPLMGILVKAIAVN